MAKKTKKERTLAKCRTKLAASAADASTADSSTDVPPPNVGILAFKTACRRQTRRETPLPTRIPILFPSQITRMLLLLFHKLYTISNASHMDSEGS